jgi:hypothetical protein
MAAADRCGRLLGYCGRRCWAIGMVAGGEVPAGPAGRWTTTPRRPQYKRMAARIRCGQPQSISVLMLELQMTSGGGRTVCPCNIIRSPPFVRKPKLPFGVRSPPGRCPRP